MPISVKDAAGSTQSLATGSGDGSGTPFKSPGAVGIGAVADVLATDSTSSWSMIALLKGILAKAIAGIVSIGPAASGAAVSGNPVLNGGSDGTNTRTMLTDALGNQVVTGKGLAVSGSGAALNATPIAATDVGDMRNVSLTILGTFVATATFEQSNDNVTWWNLTLGINSNNGVPLTASTASSNSFTYAGPITMRYFRVRISAYTSGTVLCSAWFGAIPAASQVQVVTLSSTGGTQAIVGPASDGPGSLTGLVVNSQSLLYDGSTTFFRQRGNLDAVGLASAARTAVIDTSPILNYNHRGVKVGINITAAGTGTLTFTIKGLESIGGAYYTMLASAAQSGTGLVILTVYPGVAAVANVSANDVLPKTFRVEVTGSDGSSWTYSISVVTIL
jgi:hypothetical protein